MNRNKYYMQLLYINQTLLWLVENQFPLYKTPQRNFTLSLIYILVIYITSIVINNRLLMNFFVNKLNPY